MKHLKFILLTVLTASVFFSVVIVTSCTKKPSCSAITCQNGGYCSNGSCICPTGFSGTFCQNAKITAISYQNNTFTPITIAVNGVTKTIPVGSSYAFTGKVGTVAAGSATTSGAASSLGISTPGGIIGLTINWDINNNFPTGDTTRIPLDVGATYFFLRLSNSNAKNIIDYYVNYAFSYGMTYEDITVPNTGTTYDMGYYLAYPGSNVQVQTSDSKIIWKAISLPFTNNQSATIAIN